MSILTLRKERGQRHLCRISSFYSDSFNSGCFNLAQLWSYFLSSAKPINGVSCSQNEHWTPLIFISDVNLRLWQPKMLFLGQCIPVTNSQCWFLLLPPRHWCFAAPGASVSCMECQETGNLATWISGFCFSSRPEVMPGSSLSCLV